MRTTTRRGRVAIVLLSSLFASVFALAHPVTGSANSLPYYHLPWVYGSSHTVSQGNGGSFSHQVGTQGQYAWDFAGDAFTVASARPGTVKAIQQGYGPGGCDASKENMANYVVVRSTEGDGVTVHDALYLHLAQNSVSSYVSMNAAIPASMPIARADSSGYVCGAHLHFMVMNPCSGVWWCWSVPSSFVDPDVLRQNADGIPRANQTVQSNNSIERIDAMMRGVDGQLYQKYWRPSGGNNWCDPCNPVAWTAMPPGVTSFVSDPAAVWWSADTRMEVLVEGNDGNLWDHYEQPGGQGWQSLGPYPGGAVVSDTPAVAAPMVGSRIDVFVVRGGQLSWKHWGGSQTACWTNCSWESVPAAPVSLISHPAAIWFYQGATPTIEVFADGSDYNDYVIWYQNGSWSNWNNLGPYPQAYPLSHYGAGPAASVWPDGSRLDEYVSARDDGLEYFKYWTGQPSDCWIGCWFDVGHQTSQPVTAVSDPGVVWWPWSGLRRIDFLFQGSDSRLHGRYWISSGQADWYDLGPWPAGAGTSNAPAIAAWR